MASQRLHIDPTKTLGSRISDCVNMGALFRQRLGELLLIVNKYGGDVTLQTDTGLSSTDAATFISLLTQAENEMSGVVAANVPVGQPTWTRQLLDALSLGG